MKLVPNEQVVEVFEFETADPALRGTMTTTLTDADGGTYVLVVHEGIPDNVPVADNKTGTRMALAIRVLGPAVRKVRAIQMRWSTVVDEILAGRRIPGGI